MTSAIGNRKKPFRQTTFWVLWTVLASVPTARMLRQCSRTAKQWQPSVVVKVHAWRTWASLKKSCCDSSKSFLHRRGNSKPSWPSKSGHRCSWWRSNSFSCSRAKSRMTTSTEKEGVVLVALFCLTGLQSRYSYATKVFSDIAKAFCLKYFGWLAQFVLSILERVFVCDAHIKGTDNCPQHEIR